MGLPQNTPISPAPRQPILAEEQKEGLKNILHADWRRWFSILHGILANTQTFSQELTPTSVAANTTEEDIFTVVGLTTDDIVYVNKPTHQAGLGIVNCRVSGADTLRITYMNTTGGSITPSKETYKIVSIRL